MCTVMNVSTVQQCLTGASGSKRIGARPGKPQSPTSHYGPRYTCQMDKMVQCHYHHHDVVLQHISKHLGTSMECVYHIVMQVL